MELHKKVVVDALNPDNYHRAKDMAALSVGAGGMSLSMVNIVGYIQAVGVIAGSLVACYQLWKIMKNEYRSWHRKKGANDG